MANLGAFLQKALPWIGAAATGNVPALVTLAAKAVGDAIGHPVDATPEAITTAVANASPEQIAAMRKADQDFQVRMSELGFKDAEDLRTFTLEQEKLFVADVSDARHSFAQQPGVYSIAYVVLLIEAAMIGGVLWGCYAMLTGGLSIKDTGVVAVVFTLLGAVVRDVGAKAAQVMSYFFGSTHGSAAKTDQMGDAVAALINNNKGAVK